MLAFELNNLIEDLHLFCSTDEVAAVRLAAQLEKEIGGDIRFNINPWGFELYVPPEFRLDSFRHAHLVAMAFRIVTNDGRLMKSRRPNDKVLRAAAT